MASDQQVRSHGAQVKLAYSLAIGGASLVPSIAGAYTCHDHSGFAERGGAVETLAMAGHSQCDAGLIPGLALRVPLGSSASGPAKVWLDLGASGQVIKADALTWDSAITAAGGTGGSFRSRYGFDNRYARAGGGRSRSASRRQALLAAMQPDVAPRCPDCRPRAIGPVSSMASNASIYGPAGHASPAAWNLSTIEPS